MLPLSLTFCGFVVFTNLSLLYNTVGIYQVYKTLTMPLIVIIQYYVYDENVSRKVKLCLVPIISGVFLASYYDLKFSKLGLMYALLGVVITSIYQIWVGKRQNELKITSAQLLLYQAPLSAFWLLLFIPFVEPPFEILFNNQWSFQDFTFVFISGLIALFINITIFVIIGNTSPITYNVFGQLKFALTIVCGYVLFKDDVYALQLLGILLTFFGVAFYTITKLRETKRRDLLPLLQKKTNESLKVIFKKSIPKQSHFSASQHY
ncbi:solute carrier family 35 member E3-like protein [Dinothrombium tinctorium]|uniref:Solute carrier family 35 member E3-like protein n=1 Tax=Dinothrombium tinctorium TaxID=1965070 RepID=A0A3S3SPX4_9ACAR|nr:solute carrier family 35 member E3-like protein [Dinothrombium tinctorium]RWS17307.1 solute carrier family 35 member E3-like protein [Dinothrombium tinctorium]